MIYLDKAGIEAIIGRLYLRKGERKVHQELVQLPRDASL